MLTNANFWLQVTMMPLQMFMNLKLKAVRKEKLLGISTDTTLSFEHITSLCKKVSQKLHALARIAHYMDLKKQRSLMKAFVISQLN